MAIVAAVAPVVVLVLAIAAVALVGSDRPSTTLPRIPPTPTETSSSSSAPTETPDPSSAPSGGDSALVAAEALPVKGRAPRTGYDRAAFGPAWADTDRNGCDQRNDVLRRDLDQVISRPGTHGCVVASGRLVSPYTGQEIDFVRGPRSDEVEIDHVVALSDAWQKGAQQWDAATRESFANDPGNLLAVDQFSNRSKGDGDAATWLPKAKSYRCAYVARQVLVKQRYGLWVTAAERSAVVGVLQACPGQSLPG